MGKTKEKFTKVRLSEAVYKFYNLKKVTISIVSAFVFVICCVITAYCQDILPDLSGLFKILYFTVLAVQNISITLLSVFLLDYLISSNYKQQLNEDVSRILSESSLMENFIKQEKSREILRCSMNALLGEKVSRAIDDTILNSYQQLDKNCFLSKKYFWIKLHEDKNNSQFYNCNVSVEFDIEGITGENYFEIFHTEDKSIFSSYIDNLDGMDRLLSFPFLMAKNAQNNFNVTSFKANGIDINEEKQNDLSRYKFCADVQKTASISFSFTTVLNTQENFIFEDIICVTDGFHISIDYSDTGIDWCNCYSSYKENDLKIRKSTKQLHVSVDKVILPGNLFIFIWHK